MSVAASALVNGQLFVCPTWNMVENVGFGTGTHAPRPSWSLERDTEHRPSDLDRLRWPPVSVESRIAKGFQIFTENPRGWTVRRLLPRPARGLARRLRRTYEL